MNLTNDIKERNPINLASKWAPMPSALHSNETPIQKQNLNNIREKILEGFPTYQTHTKFSIHSALPQDEAYWHFLKCFPTPSGLELFEILLNEWGKPTSEKIRFSRTDGKASQQIKPLWIVGDAGTGKTSLLRDTAALIFGKKSIDPDGNEINPEPLFISVGGKNLDELLVAKVFGTEGKRFIEDIQNRFNTNNMTSGSKKYLSEHFANHIDTDSGLLNLRTLTPNQEAIHQLKILAEFEGIPLSGSTLGIHMEEGPIIQACREGRILILDEMDKCLTGTGKKLNEILLTLSGNTRQKYNFEEGPVKYCFSPETIHNNFAIVCSSNNANDTSDPNDFHRSYLDRWRILNMPRPNLDDLAIRLAQTLLGLNPLPLLTSPLKKQTHEIIAQIAQRNGETLTEEQTLLLKRLPKTLQACRQLGAMALLWAQTLEDLESTEDEILLANEKNLPPIGVRYMQDLIQQAQAYQQPKLANPESLPNLPEEEINPLTFLESLHSPPETPEIITLSLGEKIELITQKFIRRLPIGPESQSQLSAAAILCGVLPEDDEEANQNPNKLPSIKDLLNTLEEDIEIKPETIELHKSLTEILLRKSPHLKTAHKEQIIPPVELQKLINELSHEKNKNHIICLNDQYLKEKNGRPLQLVPIKSLETPPHLTPPSKIFIDSDELESLLKHPVLKQTILENLWEKPITTPNTQEKENIDLTQSFSGENHTLRLCRILTNPTPKEKPPLTKSKKSVKTRPSNNTVPDATILLHNPTKNQGIAYNPHFQKNLQSTNLLITNSAAEAQKAIESIWDQEDISDLTYQLYSIKHPIENLQLGGNNETFFEKINAISLDEKGIEKLLVKSVDQTLPSYLEIGTRSPIKTPKTKEEQTL